MNSPYKVYKEENRASSFAGAFVIAMLVLGALGVFFATNIVSIPDFGIVDVISDVVSPSIDNKDTYIVRVFETSTEKQPKWLVNQLNDDEFWLKWLPDNGMRYYTFNPVIQKEQAQSFLDVAKKQNIEPPFWLQASRAKPEKDIKAGKVLQVHAFEESKPIRNRFIK